MASSADVASRHGLVMDRHEVRRNAMEDLHYCCQLDAVLSALSEDADHGLYALSQRLVIHPGWVNPSQRAKEGRAPAASRSVLLAGPPWLWGQRGIDRLQALLDRRDQRRRSFTGCISDRPI